jgi:hypothetical protein
VPPITAAFSDAAGPVAISANTPYHIRIAQQDTANIVFDSGTLSFSAGTYNVVVAADADNSIAPIDVDLTLKGAGPLTLEAGVNYTVIAGDPSLQEAVGQPLIQATLLTD